MDTHAIIELREVSARSGDYETLKAVSFSLAEGQTLILMGQAGSGKSSVLKAAAGILIPRSGEVLYRGRALSRFSRKEELEFRRRMGFVFQDAALWSNQSLYENLALPFRLHEPKAGKAAVEKAVRRAAERVGYQEDLRLRPAELSSGERRLIGLARALVLDPELVFLDEPLVFLDEEAAERVEGVLAELKAAGKSVLAVSSSSALTQTLADRVGVIHSGKLVAEGSFEEARAWTEPGLRTVIGRLKARGDGGQREKRAGASSDESEGKR